MWPLCISAVVVVYGFLAGPVRCQVQNLELVVTPSKLPEPASKYTAVYDGNDAIYLVGGFRWSRPLSRVVKYTLSTGVVDVIGTHRPLYDGTALIDHEDIIHIGGGAGPEQQSSDIDQISTVNGSWEVVNSLPVATNAFHVAWDRESGVAYLFGGLTSSGYSRSVLVYNARNNTLSTVGQLSEGRAAAATAWDSDRKMAYIFGGVDASAFTQHILTFNQSSGVVTKLSTQLPYAMANPRAVYVEYNGEAVILDKSGLVSFDPISQIAQRVTVDAWPTQLEEPACVYVAKLARIYIFGGYGSYNGESERFLDQISYIGFSTDEGSSTTDPSTQSPTTETPFCPPTGVHNFPYPGNCTLYIRCFDGVEQILSCAPLLFDKIELICKPPSEAVCDEEIPIQCPPTGYETHPHPTSCSKYYECNNGNAYESECAPSTYFDTTPDLMHCNLAQHAACNSECPPTGIAFIPIRARDCKWYKVCVEGNSANLECGTGEVYSPEESRCVPAETYMCPYAGAGEGNEPLEP